MDNKVLKDFKNEDYELINLKNDIFVYYPLMANMPLLITDYSSFHILNITNYTKILSNILFFDSEDYSLFTLVDHLKEISIYNNNVDFNYIEVNETKHELMLFKNERSHISLKRIKKYKIDKNKYSMELDINTNNANKYKALEIKKIEDGFLEKYYHFDIDNNKLLLSHSKEEDRPYEIEKNKYYITLDYLIPPLKKKRNLIHKPSFVKKYNNGYLCYNYIIDNKDWTNEIKKILENLNITNPVDYDFKENEIMYFKEQLKKIGII